MKKLINFLDSPAFDRAYKFIYYFFMAIGLAVWLVGGWWSVVSA